MVNKNANYKMLVVFDQIPWNTEYCFEFVIPYIESKILILPNTSMHPSYSLVPPPMVYITVIIYSD